MGWTEDPNHVFIKQIDIWKEASATGCLVDRAARQHGQRTSTEDKYYCQEAGFRHLGSSVLKNIQKCGKRQLKNCITLRKLWCFLVLNFVQKQCFGHFPSPYRHQNTAFFTKECCALGKTRVKLIHQCSQQRSRNQNFLYTGSYKDPVLRITSCLR